jgi:hypothetical protein
MATKYLNLSTDSTFSENSDYLIPSQKAIKTAVDSKQNKITTGDGLALSEDGQLTNTILDKTVLASNYVNPTLWKGTLAEYEALGTYDDNITYIITDDTDLEDMINDNLYTSFMPDPDFIIRPSGELRLSNFLMWQSAYSEFWFSDICWPDFTEKDLHRAIIDYQNRNRRFGGV